jgi:predicted RNase H-like nuclease (RuvC/YqgF family)
MTAYVEDLNEKIREQEGEKTIWELEKNRTTDEIAELKKQIEATSGSSAELEAACNKVEQLETVVRIMENAFAPKDEAIFLLKKGLVTKEKQVFQYKNSAAAKEETTKVISRELRGKEEHIADLRRELREKEYEIRSLKSNFQVPSNVSSQNTHRGATANESTLLRRIEEAQRDYTQLKNTNQSLREKNIKHQDAIKNLKRQLDLKELENKQLQTHVTGLTKQASDSLFRERR